ncbi:hypothetical protein [Herbaspirillum sp. CAH-3]|uniref:hypothetical protein n=1 Tax=Herbaspirillum sp. CAH-3 TaxID=2605746 RepID=UPI0012ACD4B1|nr:hypothetical protein [Herbaspirillum sp. CAH-3]
MATEVQKILQANREGVKLGLQQGADIMRERVLALGLPQDLAAKVAAIQINEVKK